MDVDTIVSLSTPPGVGAIAVVRLSGPDANGVLRALLPSGATMPEARMATLTELRDPANGEVLDRAVVTRFVAPASFTGEDVVELSCHGGWLVPELVVGACIQAGARQAEPGEFTRRAYLHGKLDLVQAESIADLIEARSRALHRVALGQLERGLSLRVSELRQRLVKVEALLAHHVDFPEEDDAPVPMEQVIEEATNLVRELDALIATAPEGELLREGALAVLAGRPNAGKSSMYNALIGRERAIVTEEPGTTRDALESVVQIAGYPFRLVDTAGLRESTGKVERLGIEIARQYMERADVVLFCVPADEGPTDEERAFLAGSHGAPIVLLETKADLLGDAGLSADSLKNAETVWDEDPHGGVGGSGSVAARVRVSVLTGEGLAELRDRLRDLVFSAVLAAGAEVPVLTRKRQADAIGRARGEVEAFRAGLVDGLPAEVAATHLRTAASCLEEVIGIVSVEDVLDVVFREFCVGK